MSKFTRRSFIATGLSVSAVSALAACAANNNGAMGDSALMKAIEKTEAARFSTGKTKSFALTPSVSTVQLSKSQQVTTKVFNSSLPGSLIRADYGDLIKIKLTNGLNENTSLHTHGLALRNDMDGVVGLTQNAVPAGSEFNFSFKAPHPGTYWYHSHTGLQPEEGMYGPVIIDDPSEPGAYDQEWLVMLDDWTSGIGKSPEEILNGLKAGTGSDSMGSMGGMMGGMGQDNGTFGLGMSDVTYPAFIANGKLPEDPEVFEAKPGQKIRIRLVNAASDTAFQVALAGHSFEITHTDGFAVKPVVADSLVIGMGERYDILVTVKSGVFALAGKPIGKSGMPARAILKTAVGSIPESTNDLPEFTKRVAEARHLTTTDELNISNSPSSSTSLMLMGSMNPYAWNINGKTDMMDSQVTLQQDEVMRVTFMNHSMMFHPMHLHGHTFQVRSIDGFDTPQGPRKDTVIVKPMSSVTVDVLANNPGLWALHCHNTYHMESGMMTSVKYALN